MAEAKTIVGVFGSNMLSLYSAPPGCRVICLTDEDRNAPVLRETCEYIGMSYAVLECEPVEGKKRHTKDCDLRVNLAALSRLIA
jgi:capsular polysaccharide biosynthesis protein